MTTLAEGIETQQEWSFLRSLGCQLGQGFLFSRPVPPERIVGFFREGSFEPARTA